MSLALVRRIHPWPVDSPQKGPVTWKMFPFDDVVMLWRSLCPRSWSLSPWSQELLISSQSVAVSRIYGSRNTIRTNNWTIARCPVISGQGDRREGAYGIILGLCCSMASQITSVSIVYWTVCWCAKKISQFRITGLLCEGYSPVDSSHKGPVTWKMFPFDDVIMCTAFWEYDMLPCWTLRGLLSQ